MIWLLLVSCRSAPPLPAAGRLPPCNATPNCVSSQAPGDDRHHTAPLALHGPAEDAAVRLGAVVEQLDGVAAVVVGSGSVRATFVMPSGLFTDDLDLLVDAEAGLVHVRSSSRIGFGDRGVNRARVEALRALWSPR